MKRILLPLVVVGVLLAPSAAWATGNHQQPPKPPEKSCQCCEDLSQLWTPRIVQLENRVSQLENTVVNLTNYVNQLNLNLSITINRVDALRCQSDRVYDFQVRREVDGSPVVGIAPRVGNTGGVEVIGQSVTQASDGDRGAWRTNAEGRVVVTADYRGIEAPKGQLRTVTVYARTEDGKTHRLVQKLRLCLEDDGNPNDRGAQDRAEGQS